MMSDACEEARAPRELWQIAAEITRVWKRPYFAAEPYIAAMGALRTIDDKYIAEDAREIVQRFLVNAQTWRGADARRIKAELRAML